MTRTERESATLASDSPTYDCCGARAAGAAARRSLGLYGAVLCLCLTLGIASCGGGAGEDDPIPPSVILISLDTCRAGHMGLYGYERETTPYLEKFAEECLVFDNAQTVAPWTLISHVTMLTGLYPEQHGVVEDDLALNPKIPFLAQRLQDYGYATYGLYKPGFIGGWYGHDRGFDVFEAHEIADEAAAHLSDLPALGQQHPFFLFLHLFDIHADPVNHRNLLKYNPPEPFDRYFIEDARERLAGVDFRAAESREFKLNEEQLEAMVSLYDGKIRYVDTMLEEWFEGWRASGVLDNAILIITSDHGEALGQRGGRVSGHGMVWQDALHVPLIVRFPDGYRAGEREERLVSIVDVVPTILEGVGLETDERLPGYTLRGELAPDRIVGAFRPPYHARIRLPWKVKGDSGNSTDVYNLEVDPLELDRVLDPDLFRKISTELDAAFEAELASHPAFDAPAIPAFDMGEDLKSRLRELGYGAGGESGAADDGR